MTKLKKKRRGRPPGRKAPHRPVLASRVSAEFYEQIKQAAQKSGRTISAEVVWRAQNSLAEDTQIEVNNRICSEFTQSLITPQMRAQIEKAFQDAINEIPTRKSSS